MLRIELLKLLNTCSVCGSRGRCEGMLDYFFQTNSQSSLRTPGVGVGLGSACGAKEKKRVNCCLDSASAMGFSFQGR